MKRIAPYLALALITAGLPLTIGGLYGLFLYYTRGDPREYAVGYQMSLAGSLLVALGYLASRIRAGPIRTGEGVLATTLVWLFVPVITGIPLAMALRIPLIDAIFESASGWTTTGLSIFTGEPSSWGSVYVPSIDELPGSVKLWRGMIQWLGGLGIVVFTIAFLARPGISAALLYLAEGRFERLEASLKRSATKMGIIYATLTIICITLFKMTGLSWEDSIVHSLTGIATGGFSTKSESMYFYIDNNYVLAVALFAAFLGASNFADHHSILTLRLGRLRESVELKAQLSLIALFAAAAYIAYYRDELLRETYTLKQSLFDTVSALLNVGFQTGSLGEAPGSFKFLILLATIIGGSAFSTAGGIKVLRVVIAAKIIKIQALESIKPPGYAPNKRLGKYIVDEHLEKATISVVSSFFIAYGLLVAALLVMYPHKYPLDNLLLESASALFNMGESTGITGASAPIGMKILFIGAMLMGRVEILPFIVALFYLADRARRAL